MPQENVSPICMSDREDFWKQVFYKKRTLNHQLQLCNLTEEFGKIGHAHQECALPSEKPWAIGELFPKYSQIFEWLHWLWFIQSGRPLCGSFSTCVEWEFSESLPWKWKWQTNRFYHYPPHIKITLLISIIVSDLTHCQVKTWKRLAFCIDETLVWQTTSCNCFQEQFLVQTANKSSAVEAAESNQVELDLYSPKSQMTVRLRGLHNLYNVQRPLIRKENLQ